MIKLFIYDKKTGLYKYKDTGPEDYVLIDMPEDADFTLTPPPNTHEKWYWIGDKWIADQPS